MKNKPFINNILIQMNKNKLFSFAVIITLCVLIIYVYHFWGVSLSDETTDWGAFSSYMGMGISSISIALIYITYSEQRESNKIARFEQHILSMSKTLNVLSEKYFENIEYAYYLLSKRFTLSYYDLTECERDKTANVCSYYYSQIRVDNPIVDDFNYIFRYLTLYIDYINTNFEKNIISDDDKHCHFTELACSLPESLRIIFFCWVLCDHKSSLSDYYENGLFMLENSCDNPLYDIITFVCSGKIINRRIHEGSHEVAIKLAIENRYEEQFMDTYNRLYNM